MPRQLIRVYARRYTYQLLNVSNDDNLKRYVTAVQDLSKQFHWAFKDEILRVTTYAFIFGGLCISIRIFMRHYLASTFNEILLIKRDYVKFH